MLGWPSGGGPGPRPGGGALIYFNLTYGFPHGGQGEAFAWALVAGRLKPLFYNALPLLLGFGGFWNHVKAAPAPDWSQFAVYLLVLAALALAVLGVALRGLTRERRFLWLPLMVALANGAVLVFSAYGRLLGNNDQRYFLPVYLCLPFLWAWLAEGLGRRRTLWGILPSWPGRIHVWLYPDNPTAGRPALPGGRLPSAPGTGAQGLAAGCGRGAGMPPTPLRLGDEFRLGRRPVFVTPGTSAGPGRPPRWTRAFPGLRAGPGRAARLLGSPHQVCPEKHCGYVIHHSFQEPVQANRSWTSPAPGPTTSWQRPGRAARRRRPGHRLAVDGPRADRAGVVLDLGREEMVAGIGLLPQNELEHPGGSWWRRPGRTDLRTLGQGEGLGAETRYWSGPHPFLKLRFGRTEAYFPPRPARYLRLTHLGAKRGAWSLGELLVYGAEPAARRLLGGDRGPAPGGPQTPGAPAVFADAWPRR